MISKDNKIGPFTCAAASLTGHASNVTGAEWTISTVSAGDGLEHQVTIRNDSATDHGAKTIVLVGTDTNGNAVTETLSAPGTSATVTSVKFYKTLTSATPSATIGTDTFDIGWTAAAHSPWIPMHNCPATAAVVVSGTINFDIQHTHDENYAHTFDVEAAKTANQEHSYTTPVHAVRVDVNSHTSGVFTLYLTELR